MDFIEATRALKRLNPERFTIDDHLVGDVANAVLLDRCIEEVRAQGWYLDLQTDPRTTQPGATAHIWQDKMPSYLRGSAAGDHVHEAVAEALCIALESRAVESN